MSVEAGQTPLRRWLLQRPLQDDGSMVGSYGVDGQARYVYPEIAGYYLSWLAWLQLLQIAPADMARRCAGIASWLQRWQCSGGLTRPGLATKQDWRNRGRFAFDLAVLLRGLAAAKACAALDPAVANRLAAQLIARLVELLDSRGELRAVLVLHGSLPQRWSTQSGPYQAKVAAALLGADAQFGLPTVLTDWAQRQLLQSARACTLPLHNDSAHAALYALEGLSIGLALGRLQMEVHALIATRLEALRPSPADAADATGERRHDVLAQWLRLARLHCPDDPAIPAAQRQLRAAIDAAGGLPFASAPLDQGLCTWAALFADQALCALPLNAEDLI